MLHIIEFESYLSWTILHTDYVGMEESLAEGPVWRGKGG